ncbi:MAG TPA: aminotransferase class I/II-fold pyridoxal phosphate-dependent enzyme [Pyrinomonadaceae bacterium]|nr:aminotransferase class I/II-fold pyridoxal phosphate-dependent enzyme [Pyrinomonadaceae bacterium]
MSTVGDLAIFGGTPAFKNELHVGQPNIGNREKFIAQVNDIFDRRWLTNGGTYVTEFEKRIAEVINVKHCIAMCNATVGLEIAIRALGLTGEVIIPSFTFVATANALQWQGIKPVFCDIDPRTHSLDPAKVEKLINDRTTGIIGVHLWGKPCDIDGLIEVAKRNNLKLLFDSAHAFGCSYKKRMVGNFGDAEVFSFHATKFLNSLEGGAVVTNNDELAQKLRLMRNFGFTSYDRTDSIGVNGKLNEVSAAMGLTNLDSMDEFIAINRRHYKQYQDHLAGFAGLSFLPYDDNERSNYQYVVLEVDESKCGVTRDELLQILHAENVLARRYFYPGCHKMEPYKSLYPDAHLSLPETEFVAARVLTLPTGQAITPEIIRGVCMIIATVLHNAIEVRKRLEERPPA